MSNELIIGIVAALTGVLGAAVGALASYLAPKWLEEEREKREEARIWGPRKILIKDMLDKAAPGKGRSFHTLKRVTGTPDDDLRRLLVELGARGFTRRPENVEAWIYARDRPLEHQEAEQGAAANP